MSRDRNAVSRWGFVVAALWLWPQLARAQTPEWSEWTRVCGGDDMSADVSVKINRKPAGYSFCRLRNNGYLSSITFEVEIIVIDQDGKQRSWPCGSRELQPGAIDQDPGNWHMSVARVEGYRCKELIDTAAEEQAKKKEEEERQQKAAEQARQEAERQRKIAEERKKEQEAERLRQEAEERKKKQEEERLRKEAEAREKREAQHKDSNGRASQSKQSETSQSRSLQGAAIDAEAERQRLIREQWEIQQQLAREQQESQAKELQAAAQQLLSNEGTPKDRAPGYTWEMHLAVGLGTMFVPILTDVTSSSFEAFSTNGLAGGLGTSARVELAPVAGPLFAVGAFGQGFAGYYPQAGGGSRGVSLGMGGTARIGPVTSFALLAEASRVLRLGSESTNVGAGIIDGISLGTASYWTLRLGGGGRLCIDVADGGATCDSGLDGWVLLDRPAFLPHGASAIKVFRLSWWDRNGMQVSGELGLHYPSGGRARHAIDEPSRGLLAMVTISRDFEFFGQPYGGADSAQRTERP